MTRHHSLECVRVGFTHAGTPTPVLHDVNIHIGHGWWGVAGANGAGKSTLLRLLTGDLEPTTGELRATATPLLCPQSVATPGALVEEALCRWDADAMRVRERLGLDDARVWDGWQTMSAGERKRWQVGAALMLSPAALLLDEPTNHLDASSRRMLLDALADYDGVGVVVSHDRDFLDALTSHTLWIESGRLTHYTASYSGARAQREDDRRATLERRESLRAKTRALERRYRHAQSERTRSESSITSKHRMKGPKDTDARSMAAKSRAMNAERSLARTVSATRTKLDGARRELDRADVVKKDRTILAIQSSPCPRRVLLNHHFERVEHAGGAVCIESHHAILERGSRVWLTGRNGAGKSTLMRALLARLELDAERLVWLPQELPEAHVDTITERVRDAVRRREGHWFQIAHALGVDPGALIEAEHLSPGTLRKVELARALTGEVWCVALDEPTNHLDVGSIEELEAALGAYSGCLLLVSHDERLARATCTERWHVDAGRVTISSLETQ